MRRVVRNNSSSNVGSGVTRGNLKRTKSSDDSLDAILANKRVVFTITYCRDGDNGLEEYNTAADCVRTVFPGSEIIENTADASPTILTIEAEVFEIQEKEEEEETIPESIWTGPQLNLSQTNPADRSKAAREIKARLREFIAELAEE